MLKDFLVMDSQKSPCEIFGLDKDQSEKIIEKFDKSTIHICDNIDDFTVNQICKHGHIHQVINEGKVLGYLLDNCATTPQEELFTLYCLRIAAERIYHQSDLK